MSEIAVLLDKYKQDYIQAGYERHIAGVIATEVVSNILDERERCAKIAEESAENANRFMQEKIGKHSERFEGFANGANSVARKIRGTS